MTWYLIVMSSYVGISITPMPSERACLKVASVAIEMLTADKTPPVAKCIKVKL